jgi:1-acyl-sn-glycerol-3-phosphate acyltransferase
MQQLFYALCRHIQAAVGLRCGASVSRTAPHLVPIPSSTAPARQMPLTRRIIKAILAVYLRLFHHLSMEGFNNVPARGPLIVVVNHASLLDVPVLMVVDPFPDTATIVKASMFNMPIVSWFLRQWGAIPVERQGRDSSGVRRMLGVLRAGGVMAIAAEGTRARNGHLGPINPVLAKIAAGAHVPVLPVGIRGSFEALPSGARLPRPTKITVRVGKPFRFDSGTDATAAAQRIRREIAALLPSHMQPL